MSFREEIIEFIIKICADQFGRDPATLNEDTSFVGDLNCKSADIVRITAEIENEYDLEVPFMTFNRAKTIGEAGDTMCRLSGLE